MSSEVIYLTGEEGKQEDYLFWNSLMACSHNDVLGCAELCLKMGIRPDRIREMVQGQ